MTKFGFRLESVLRLRTLELAAARLKLGRILEQIAQLERSLAASAKERSEAVTFVQNQPAIGNVELRSLSAFLLGCDARTANLRDAVKRARQLLEQQRQAVLAAGRNERLLEKLKEKKLAQWRRESDRELETLAQEAWNSTQQSTRRDWLA